MKILTDTFNVKIFLVLILLNISLIGGTYDSTYSVVKDDSKKIEKNFNLFMDGEFSEIIRFDGIAIDDSGIKEESRETLKDAVNKIKSYKDDEREILVSVIGHSYLEENNRSDEYAQRIKEYILEHNISKNIITSEFRGAQDIGYTDATNEGKDLSNRVMVTLYVGTLDNIDSDKDGVYNPLDRCPNTPLGVVVDKHGCPIDSDRDGVADYKDKCPDTPLGYRVDRDGCPIDSDLDGVLNYKDLCPATPQGLKVDINGCPFSESLSFSFKFDSFEIDKVSNPLILKYSKFLRKLK